MKPIPGRLTVVPHSLPAKAEQDPKGSTAIAEPRDDDVVSLSSQALRTPIDSMVVFAELIASPDVNEEQRELYTNRLRRESRRLSGLINNAIALQRLEAGRRDLDLGPVDVGSLIRRAVAAAGDEYDSSIRVQSPAGLPLVWADDEAIIEVMDNFIDNARRFSLGGGDITIEASSAGDMVEVSIRDHGIGLDAIEVPKVFHKFYQAQNGIRMREPGAGLGLAINRRIIESHGGQVEAASDGPGKGSSFRFTLPLAKPVAKAAFVLIVDNDAAFARVLRTELATAGIETLRAADVETAQQLLVDASPLAIVVDLGLTGLPNDGFLAELSTTQSTHLPVLVLAGNDVPATDLAALEDWGVIAVLPKEAGTPQAAATLIAEVVSR